MRVEAMEILLICNVYWILSVVHTTQSYHDTWNIGLLLYFLACDREEVFDIISNTSVKCSENVFTVTRTDENESVGYKCPICQLQILPKLCKEPGIGE